MKQHFHVPYRVTRQKKIITFIYDKQERPCNLYCLANFTKTLPNTLSWTKDLETKTKIRNLSWFLYYFIKPHILILQMPTSKNSHKSSHLFYYKTCLPKIWIPIVVGNKSSLKLKSFILHPCFRFIIPDTKCYPIMCEKKTDYTFMFFECVLIISIHSELLISQKEIKLYNLVSLKE